MLHCGQFYRGKRSHVEEDRVLYLELIEVLLGCQILEAFWWRSGASFVLRNCHGPHHWNHGHGQVLPALNALLCQDGFLS